MKFLKLYGDLTIFFTPSLAKPGRKPRTKKEKVDASKPSAAPAAKKPQNENVLNNVKVK